jgi:hypothetical protein
LAGNPYSCQQKLGFWGIGTPKFSYKRDPQKVRRWVKTHRVALSCLVWPVHNYLKPEKNEKRRTNVLFHPCVETSPLNQELGDFINREKFGIDQFNCLKVAGTQSLGPLISKVKGFYYSDLR